jgi:hypothetical protein
LVVRTKEGRRDKEREREREREREERERRERERGERESLRDEAEIRVRSIRAHTRQREIVMGKATPRDR